MFRSSLPIQQQLRRSRWLHRPAALLAAGTLSYVAHQSQQEQEPHQHNDAKIHWEKNQSEGLMGVSLALTAFPSILQPNYALCEESVRQKRDRYVATIRDMLLENPNLEPKKYKRGHIVHKAGEQSRGLCIVLDGEISLSTGLLSVSRKHKGDIFGALSLVTEGYGPRRFTARCISDECTIVEIGQEDFDKAIAAHPELFKGLKDICLCQEFQRLIVLYTKKHFPKNRDGVRSLFGSIKYSKGPELKYDDVHRVIRAMDRKKTDEDIAEIFAAMDVDGNGGLSVDEFEAIFYEI